MDYRLPHPDQPDHGTADRHDRHCFSGTCGRSRTGASAIAGVYYLAIFMMAFGFSIGAQILIARRNGEQQYQAIGPHLLSGCLLSAFTRSGSIHSFAVLLTAHTEKGH